MSEESRVLEGEDTKVDMCPGMLGPSRTQGQGGGPAAPLTLRPCPLQVTGLSVTSGRDQLVVLHARGYDDLVESLGTGRAVAAYLRNLAYPNPDLLPSGKDGPWRSVCPIASP